MVPDLRSVASLSQFAVGAMTDIRSAWIDWMGQTTLIGTRLSQELLRQAGEQQQRFAADVVKGWMEHNTRVMQIMVRPHRKSLRRFRRAQEWSLTRTLCVRWSWSGSSTTARGAGP